MIHGNTEGTRWHKFKVGIEMRFKQMPYRTFVYPTAIKQLQETSVTETGVFFGSGMTLTCFRKQLSEFIQSQSIETTLGVITLFEK